MSETFAEIGERVEREYREARAWVRENLPAHALYLEDWASRVVVATIGDLTYAVGELRSGRMSTETVVERIEDLVYALRTKPKSTPIQFTNSARQRIAEDVAKRREAWAPVPRMGR